MSDYCASMDDVIERICYASDLEINRILDAVTLRYCRLFPEWDILFLSLPKEPEQRRSQLEQMLRMLVEGQLF